ncbi:hypothetical protein PHISP_06141, partial [Aspergillus sp. HF37]
MTAPNPDVILNKANIALSRSQRIVASWLPPRTSEELQSSNDPRQQDLDNEEEKEIFTPTRSGRAIPQQNTANSNGQDGTPNRGDQETNEKLRRQLLGRNYKRVLKEQERDASLASSRQKGSASASS